MHFYGRMPLLLLVKFSLFLLLGIRVEKVLLYPQRIKLLFQFFQLKITRESLILYTAEEVHFVYRRCSCEIFEHFDLCTVRS